MLSRQRARYLQWRQYNKFSLFINFFQHSLSATVCTECQNHRLELEFAPARASSFRENYTKKHKKENFVGALSYHKPSTISQRPNSSPSVGGDSICDESCEKKSFPTHLTALVCPGGTFFTSAVVRQPTATNRHEEKSQVQEGFGDQAMSSDTLERSRLKRDGAYRDTSSTQKRKHSVSEEEQSLVKKGGKESRMTDPQKNNFEIPDSLCNNNLCLDNHVPPGTKDFQSHEDIATSSDSSLCRSLSVDILPEHDHSVSDDFRLVRSQESELDTMDGRGSDLGLCDESCPSPRQSYLSRHKSMEGLRRRPSLRFHKIRRKLEKLICRPKSYPEYQIDVEAYESQEEIESRYLEVAFLCYHYFILRCNGFFHFSITVIFFQSIRIPAPAFMMRNREQSDFIMHR